MARRVDAEKALADQMNILPKKELVILYIPLAVSLLTAMIDQNGISVMLPNMAQDLGGEQTISWAGTSALIANTVFTVLYGRLSDIFGRKGLLLGVIALLSLATLIGGFVQNAPSLYVLRAIAGIADGGITSMTMIIVSDVVTLRERGKYQGILGTSIGLGNVIGPFIGAAFVQNSTWRAFFYLLAPLAAVCGGVVYLGIPPPKAVQDDGKTLLEKVKQVDFYGLFASTAAIIFLLIPISGGGSYFEWDSPMVISMLVIGGLSLIAFIFIEWKVSRLPMLPLSLFKNRSLMALFVQTFLWGASYQSYLYYLPFYFQNVRQWTPVVSAGLTASMVGVQAVCSVLAGLYMNRRNRYNEVLCFGFALWTLGTGVACIFDRSISPSKIAGVLIVTGVGIGNVFQPCISAIQAHTTKAQRAVSVSARNFFRCMGGACGLAISAAILQSQLKKNLPTEYSYLASSAYSVPTNIPAADLDAVLNAYMKGSRGVFIFQPPLVGACLLLCSLIRDRGLDRKEDVKAREAGQELEQHGNEPASDDGNRAPREQMDLLQEVV